ncbi:MAG: DNA (cytosine-5-)-methyltransferase [Planctomycetes bacterium]|nr:DNA (cytosine-5-)-methyltransferase [Planctomycetota bacterium]
MVAPRRQSGVSLRVAGLFAGIGGIELGLAKAGHTSTLLCENDPGANAVLDVHFPEVERATDVRTLDALPRGTDLLAAGFPCQDLSQAGSTRGIAGDRSGLIAHVFRLLASQRVPWVLIENVPFMLRLGRGAAMNYITSRLEDLGYRWAYRVIDTRAFGLPQRRERVFILASLAEDPSARLLTRGRAPTENLDHRGRPCGFYWTEGIRGLGWAVDAVPTLKGGSTIGIPSPPALWMPDGRFVTPDIRDAERMQGFRANWTHPAETAARPGHRWKLVGNAVTVDVVEWIGQRLAKQSHETIRVPIVGPIGDSWPRAAFGSASGRFAVDAGAWPVSRRAQPIQEFLLYPARELSLRAISGFARRLVSSSLRAPEEFREALRLRLQTSANTRN